MKKHLLLLLAGSALALSGCTTPPHADKWEYKTVILKNNSQADPLRDPNDGWEDDDKIINEMVKEGWVVAGYNVDLASGQWFLLKRHTH